MLLFVLVSFLVTVKGDQLPTCQPSNFHYEYTECDSEGSRWRVSVPKPNVCVGGNPNPPVRGKDCKFTCTAGTFLDMESQDCKSCPAGTYSLGGGVRFDEWTQIPKGFEVKSESFSTENLFGKGSGEKEDNSTTCTLAGWKPRFFSVAAYSKDCISSLIYTANLVRAGRVKFEYQYEDDNSVFHFVVQNDQCMSYGDKGSSHWPSSTKANEWGSVTVNLKSGVNILKWKLIGIGGSKVKFEKLARIRLIEIEGVGYTSECNKCPAGTYSLAGNSSCISCPENTFSVKGSTKCTSCNSKTEYSVASSAKCTKRPACQEKDYFQYSTPCDDKQQTRKMYKWKEPKICREDVKEAKTFPASGQPEACPPCNPGMWRTNGSHCDFCPPSYYGDGSKACEKCPINTAPLYGIQFRWWNELPPNMKSICASSEDHGCSTKGGWLPSGDHIHSGLGHSDDAYLMMTMKISGFHGSEGVVDGKAVKVGEIDFVFELTCDKESDTSEPCQLFFMEQTEDRGGTSVVQSWKGSHSKQSYRYAITRTGPVTFSWAFQKTTHGDMFSHSDPTNDIDDMAKIYSIDVNNTLDGGASRCEPCPRGSEGNECVPCEFGKYIETNTTQCQECPHNTVIHTTHGHGIESCKACGEGLTAIKHQACFSNCLYSDHMGRKFDFAKFRGFHEVSGATLFTGSGTQYFHHFNFSLCGEETMGQTLCANNVSLAKSKHHLFDEDERVKSQVCRMIVIPPKGPRDKGISAQPVSLGDYLIEVTGNTSQDLFKMMKDEGFDQTSSDIFTHFIFKTDSTTKACQIGRKVIITLHCDISEKGNGTIELPSKCPDGTCDGCIFHMMWHSRHACPRCERADYEVVKGECINGKQKVHYYPPKHCMIEGGEEPLLRVVKCSTMTIEMYIAIGLAAFVAVILVTILLYCWNRNRSLEYKYMKLVSGSKDGELPAAETCGYDEEDEDEQFDTVEFKNKSFFQKFKGIGKKDDNPFESIQLTDKKAMSTL